MHLHERLHLLLENAKRRRDSNRAELEGAMPPGAVFLHPAEGDRSSPTDIESTSIARSASAVLFRETIEPRLRTLVDILDDIAWVSDRQAAQAAVYLDDHDLGGLRARFGVSVFAEGDGHLLVEAEQHFREREDEVEDGDGPEDGDTSRRLRVAAHPLEEARVGHFLDDRIVCFMASLDARRREIAGRPENLVTDPVCGMAFSRLDAPAEAVYDGTRYHFCLEVCRDRFLADPARYARQF